MTASPGRPPRAQYEPAREPTSGARYVLRPPVAQTALELLPDGNVLLKLRRAWRDGTRAILLEPCEVIARLASLVPRPRVNHSLCALAETVEAECAGRPIQVMD